MGAWLQVFRPILGLTSGPFCLCDGRGYSKATLSHCRKGFRCYIEAAFIRCLWVCGGYSKATRRRFHGFVEATLKLHLVVATGALEATLKLHLIVATGAVEATLKLHLVIVSGAVEVTLKLHLVVAVGDVEATLKLHLVIVSGAVEVTLKLHLVITSGAENKHQDSPVPDIQLRFLKAYAERRRGFEWKQTYKQRWSDMELNKAGWEIIVLLFVWKWIEEW